MTSAPPAAVLIVDDDAAATEMFARMLRLEGYNVLTALDATAAFEVVETSHPDAILLDLGMPGVDGLEFLRRLRGKNEHRATPVAVVTGIRFLDDSVVAELHDLGAQLRFKPLWFEDLLVLVHGLVGHA